MIFTPTTSGARSGTIILTDSAGDRPQSIALTGSGVDFSMPSSGGTATIKAGATAAYSAAISPIGGAFGAAVTLTCAGVPAYSTCTVNPASVTPGVNPATVAVSIKTTAASAQLGAPPLGQNPILAASLVGRFGLLGMFLIGARPRRRLARVLLGTLLVTAILFWAGCGSSTTAQVIQKGNFTPPGTYTVLVIGSSGGGQHFSSVTLTVQ